jgi:hypothetical protein
MGLYACRYFHSEGMTDVSSWGGGVGGGMVERDKQALSMQLHRPIT